MRIFPPLELRRGGSLWTAQGGVALCCLVVASGCLPARFDDATINSKLAAASKPAAVDTSVTDASKADVTDTEAAPDTTVPPTPTCWSLRNCVDACADENCETACRNQADESARKMYDALTTCTDACTLLWNRAKSAVCASRDDDDCTRPCRLQDCRAQFVACAADDSSAGAGSCFDGERCLEACATAEGGDGLDCGEACVADMSSVDRQALVNSTACFAGISNAGLTAKQQTQKWVKQCGSELAKCYVRGQSGGAPCLVGLKCLDVCDAKGAGGSPSCSTDCAKTLTSNAQRDYIGVLACLGANPTAGWEVLSTCDWALSDCVGNVASKVRCSAVLTNYVSCRKKNSGQFYGCLGKAMTPGQPNSNALFLKLLSCRLSQCSPECDQPASNECSSCLSQKCKSPGIACNKDK